MKRKSYKTKRYYKRLMKAYDDWFKDMFSKGIEPTKAAHEGYRKALREQMNLLTKSK